MGWSPAGPNQCGSRATYRGADTQDRGPSGTRRLIGDSEDWDGTNTSPSNSSTQAIPPTPVPVPAQ